ncbi:hypothetical protein PMAYCL1PPCAC_10913 [Pristionchus mayeri]|uniref:Uncharacterized protein n=1 Tax=Pristionchus mayeri TaxID=1317129 RepID=A0AAN4ZGE9_9BILA|nr:hypothetical protein PMAYCL1PPCAC_10913 [Pristionchus mayeri]
MRRTTQEAAAIVPDAEQDNQATMAHSSSDHSVTKIATAFVHDSFREVAGMPNFKEPLDEFSEDDLPTTVDINCQSETKLHTRPVLTVQTTGLEMVSHDQHLYLPHIPSGMLSPSAHRLRMPIIPDDDIDIPSTSSQSSASYML